MKKQTRTRQDKQVQKNLDWLIEFAECLGFDVEMSTHSTICFNDDFTDSNEFDKGLITLQRHRNTSLTLYDLLHELAHYKIRKDWKQYAKRYPTTSMLFLNNNNKVVIPRNARYYTEVVREEFEAWELALQTAGEFKIKIDKEHFQRYAANSIYSYMTHFTNKTTKKKSKQHDE